MPLALGTANRAPGETLGTPDEGDTMRYYTDRTWDAFGHALKAWPNDPATYTVRHDSGHCTTATVTPALDGGFVVRVQVADQGGHVYSDLSVPMATAAEVTGAVGAL